MSFIGCERTNVMKFAFGSDVHRLCRKKFLQDFRALRLVTEEVLPSELAQTKTQEELMNSVESG